MQADSESVRSVLENIAIIGIVGLAIFAYLLLLIRKRWKRSFLHEPVEDHKPENKK
jgi:hypothetical protein